MAASNPEVVPIAGGTDVMVELNMDLARPETLMDVSRLPELAEWRRERPLSRMQISHSAARPITVVPSSIVNDLSSKLPG